MYICAKLFQTIQQFIENQSFTMRKGITNLIRIPIYIAQQVIDTFKILENV